MSSGFSASRCGFCEKESPDMKSCTKCHLTPYCSKQCQKKDWQRHKQWCQILQGGSTFQGNKSLFSPPGGEGPQAQGSEEPYLSQGASSDQRSREDEVRSGNPSPVLNGSSRLTSQTSRNANGKKKPPQAEESKCSWCKKVSTNSVHCSGCKVMTYCSDTCQKMDWVEGHEKACKRVPQSSNDPQMPISEKEASNAMPEDVDINTCDWCQVVLESPLKCSGCDKAKYCSRACQKKDWGRQHKRVCEKRPTQKKAERSVDNTVSGRPIDEATGGCDWCQKYMESPLKCSGCKKAKYCSEGCQKKDWARQHKTKCDRSKLAQKKQSKSTAATKDAPEAKPTTATRDAAEEKSEEPPMCCNWCQKFVERSVSCEGCSKVIYCSRECKNKDWMRDHKQLCDGKENQKRRGGTKRPSADDPDDGKDRCQACKKRGKDMKKCARCKVVLYCSKSCQRQDWSAHKKECVEVEGVIKTKQYVKAVREEEEARQRRRDVPISPLEAMAHMMGLLGRPEPEVQPRMSWAEARRLARLKFPGFQIVEDFDDLPGEFLWMVPVTYNKVLLAYICRHHHHFARHAVYIRDVSRQETAVMFYLDFDNPLPFFSWGQVVPGNYICIRNAIFHNFLDGSMGIRVDEAADIKILG